MTIQKLPAFLLFLTVITASGQGVESPFEKILPPPEVTANDSSLLSLTVIASNLDVPWDIAWGPDNWLWYAEQPGTISKVNPHTGERKLILRISPDVFRYRTRGLLCMALHPDMKKAPFVVVNYYFMKGNEVWSRWARYTYDGAALIEPVILLEAPSIAGHNGSRAAITPDGKVLIALGDEDHKNDAANSGVAQRLDMTGGKILRLNLDGTIPDDNPFPGSPVWSLGFRVPQGLVYAANGQVYSAEHGHLTDDEVNLIRKGANYGYPNVSGICDEPREKDFCESHQVTPPLIAWTPTIAPSGLDYYNHDAIPDWKNSLLLVTLKTQSLRVLKLNKEGDAVIGERVYLENRFGRLRDVCVSPDGDVYVSTSNLDWNPVSGFPMDKDDRIIRISSDKRINTVVSGAAERPSLPAQQPRPENVLLPTPGAQIYTNYCASCHKTDGAGVPGTFPPLKGSLFVSGDKHALIRIVLDGLSGSEKKYATDMPSFNFLSDQQVADVVSFVRSAFGGKKDGVTSRDVNSIRRTMERER